ncbi:MAG: hypothetical protein WCY68_06125 [Desulfuromonadales bacterium]
MKKLKIALVAGLMMACTSPALGLEVSGDVYVSVFSDYIWRGFDLTGEDNFVIQPGADVSVGSFTVSWWGNFSENTGEMNEVDLTLDYRLDINDRIAVSFGNILYDIDGATDTHEIYAGLGVNALLSPSLFLYYDYDEFDGNIFAVLSIGHSFDVTDSLGLNFGAAASYLNDDDIKERWFHNAELSAGVDFAATDQITISARALYSTPLSDAAEDFAEIDDEFTAGLTVALAF